MNCVEATKIKQGFVSSTLDFSFIQDSRFISLSTGASLTINTSYKDTCAAQKGIFDSNYCIRRIDCRYNHIFLGKAYSEVLNFGGLGFFGNCRFTGGEGYIWDISIVIDAFGGALPYFETNLNAYGRAAKKYYETYPQILQSASKVDGIIILNAYNPDTGYKFPPTSDQAFARIEGLNYAIGSDIEKESTGKFELFEFIQDENGGYWSGSEYAFTCRGKRVFQSIKVYEPEIPPEIP